MVCNKGVRHFPEHLKGLPKHLAVDRPRQVGAEDLRLRQRALVERRAHRVAVELAVGARIWWLGRYVFFFLLRFPFKF